MTKVVLVTLHRVFNYGSVLQTYATQRLIEQKGCQCEVVDYITKQRTLKRRFKMQSKYAKSGIKGKIFKVLKNVSVVIKYKTFNKFIKQNINLTKNSYITCDDIKKDVPKGDIYMVGSDQVWNSVYNEGVDKGFYLDFAPKGCKKIAFCSSFGIDLLPENEIDITKQYLEQFDMISLREAKSNNIFKQIAMDNQEVLIDPTLQLDRKEYDKLANKRLVKKPYLLLFALYNEDEKVTKIAKEIADSKGLMVVKLSWDLFKDERVDKLYTHRQPKDFLSLFMYADYIVTNSFHGLAFSLIFNKQFMSVQRNEFNERISNLLNVVGLSERLINKEINYNIVNKLIDYNIVNEIIINEREKADAFLTKALGEYK